MAAPKATFATNFPFRLIFSGWVACIIIAGTLVFSIYNQPLIETNGRINVSGMFIDTISAVAGGSTAYLLVMYLVLFWYRARKIELRSDALSSEADSLQAELAQDFVTNLVRINFKYIDKYYLQTQQQANKSFVLSAVASVAGFAILCAGIILMFTKQTSASTISAASGVLSEFIAAVYFYLYNKTVISMASYHQKLVITQNISLGLKITNELPEKERVQAQLALIEALTKDVNYLLSGQAITSEKKDSRSRTRPRTGKSI